MPMITLIFLKRYSREMWVTIWLTPDFDVQQFLVRSAISGRPIKPFHKDLRPSDGHTLLPTYVCSWSRLHIEIRFAKPAFSLKFQLASICAPFFRAQTITSNPHLVQAAVVRAWRFSRHRNFLIIASTIIGPPIPQ